MEAKEKIKNVIEQLSSDDLDKVYLFIASLSKENHKPVKIRSLSLGGKLDGKIIRSLAYE